MILYINPSPIRYSLNPPALPCRASGQGLTLYIYIYTLNGLYRELYMRNGHAIAHTHTDKHGKSGKFVRVIKRKQRTT